MTMPAHLTDISLRLGCKLLLLLLAIFNFACSGVDTPDSPEPVVTMADATGITRTEAVISASIAKAPQSKLDFITIYHSISRSDDWTATQCDPDASLVTVSLQDLRPGTSYSCYAEVGTATATVRSNTISFTTVPNSRPSLAPLTILSTGPVGIIVSLEITDNGGEPLVEAGCEVAAADGGEPERFLLDAENLTVGSHHLLISGLTPEMKYTITPFASNTAGKTDGTPIDYTTANGVILEDVGQLATLLQLTDPALLPDPLSIAGPMNGDDFRFLRALLGAPVTYEHSLKMEISAIDLSDVTICEGGASYDGSRFTVTDVITTGLFADCTNLEMILLPASATTIERDALARCTSLSTLSIPAGISQLLPSSDCSALTSIEVSPANENYAAVDGVLFNRDITDILWFPKAKTGRYTLPSSITAIAEDAFAGTSITSLEIPTSVTDISHGAFAGSSLEEISLPDNLAQISVGLFQNCTNLMTVHLGSGTELIGDYAFDGTSLSNLYVRATIPPVVRPDAFVNKTSSITTTCTLHVPAASKAIYRNHQRWGKFEKIEVF